MSERPVRLERWPGEIVMTRYSVGDMVLIRYGRHQGHKGTILKRQPAEVYEIKGEDGATLFFSGEGLERVMERVSNLIEPDGGRPIPTPWSVREEDPVNG